MQQPSLFPQIDDLPILPFPGNKRKYLTQFLGCEQYHTLISPFLGSGALELASPAPLKFVADADVVLYGQWRYILANQWGLVLGGMRFYQKQISDLISTPSYAAYKALPARQRRRLAPDYPLALVFLEKMDLIWDGLIDHLQNSYSPLQQAIAAFTIRKLAFGSVIRQGKGGQLNIKWATDKLEPFINFNGTQPYIKGKWSLHNDCFKAISDFNANGKGDAISIIDPPYWLPSIDGVRNQMTPCYPGHKPHAVETFNLGIESLRQLAERPLVKRIVYCNYFSDPMNDAVVEIAKTHGWKVEWQSLGVLDGMNRGNGLNRKKNLDHAWILTRKN